MSNIYTDEVLKVLKKSVIDLGFNKKQTVTFLQEELGISKRQARRVNSKYNICKKDGGGKSYKVNYVDEETKRESSNPKSLEDIVKDLNVDINKWNVKNFRTEGPKADGKYTYNVSFEAKPIDKDALLKQFVSEAEKHAPKNFKFENIDDKEKDYLYVLNIHDLHLASMVYKKETRFANYDIKIAKNIYLDTVADLISKAPRDKISKVVVICGSDFFNVDTEDLTTFGDTRVDTDSRFSKIFSEGCDLLVEVINKLSVEFIVHVVVIPGNHDRLTANFAGAYLSAYYRNAKDRIFVDNAPTSRKYVKHNKVIVGFEHGDQMPLKNLPLVLINEIPDLAKYKCKTFLTGHLHTDICREFAGITIRTSPSLSAYTKWASDKGFVGNIRCAQGLLFAKDHLSCVYYSVPVE